MTDEVLDVLLRKARTHNAWLPQPVPDDLLRQFYGTLSVSIASTVASLVVLWGLRAKASQ